MMMVGNPTTRSEGVCVRMWSGDGEMEMGITQDEMYTILGECGLCKPGASSFMSQVLS